MKLSEFSKLQDKTKSIFEEIVEYKNDEDRDDIIHSRADHIIQSIANLVEDIQRYYDSETADLLKRRLMNSINSGDSKKFTRCIRKVKESKCGRK